jgi:hypothetical protein
VVDLGLRFSGNLGIYLAFSRRRFGKAYLFHYQGSKNSSWTA